MVGLGSAWRGVAGLGVAWQGRANNMNTKVNIDDIAHELARQDGRDYDELPYHAKITYRHKVKRFVWAYHAAVKRKGKEKEE